MCLSDNHHIMGVMTPGFPYSIFYCFTTHLQAETENESNQCNVYVCVELHVMYYVYVCDNNTSNNNGKMY